MRIFTQVPEDHPHFALIGRVASAWTNFEHSLDQIIWELIDIPHDVALCITGQLMGANARFKIINALALKIGLAKVDLALLEKLKGHHRPLNDERNRIVHDPWFVDLATSLGMLAKPEISQLKVTGYIPVTTSEITKTIGQIEKLIVRATEIRVSLKAALRSLREKQLQLPPV